MTPSRLTRARQLAGLSIAQATRLLGWTRTQPLLDLETGDAPLPDDVARRLAELYGVTLAWLRGEPVELPAATRDVLRDMEHDGARAELTELLEATQGVRTR